MSHYFKNRCDINLDNQFWMENIDDSYWDLLINNNQFMLFLL